MATTPPTSTDEPAAPPVQVIEDPASIALRSRIAENEEKQTATMAAMHATQQALVTALSAPPAVISPTDAQLWNGYMHTAMAGLMRHPNFDPAPLAASLADGMLKQYRARYPLTAG